VGNRGKDMIRIMIVDDQSLIRDGLAMLLNLRSELEVVGTANDGDEVVRIAEQLQPEIILMDIRMPVLDGWRATRQILDLELGTAVILISSYSGREIARISEEVGAKGFVPKDNLAASLLTAIKAVYRGGTFFGE